MHKLNNNAHQSERKRTGFGLWKSVKQWMTAATIVVALMGTGTALVTPGSPLAPITVTAATIPPADGSNFGTLNGKQVAQSKTQDMKSDSFQRLANAFLKDAAPTQTVVNNVGWGAGTTLENGTPLLSHGGSAWMADDGFTDSDLAVNISKNGGRAKIKSVGTARVNGQNVQLDLGITVNNVFTTNDGIPGAETDSVIMAVKNQGGVITLDFMQKTGAPNVGGGGGEGSRSRSFVDPNQAYAFLKEVQYSVTLLNASTGQPLANNAIAAMKLSDIDASQNAGVGSAGKLGYIVGPNTNLSISGTGFTTSQTGGSSADSTLLTPNAYVTLMQGAATSVRYAYTGGITRNTLATGIFGNTGINLLTPPTPPTLAAVPAAPKPTLETYRTFPKAPELATWTNPVKDVLNMDTGESVDGGETLPDVAWDYVVSQGIDASDTQYSDYLKWVEEVKAIDAENKAIKARNEAKKEAYGKAIDAANAVVKANQALVDKYNAEYAEYKANGGTEEKATFDQNRLTLLDKDKLMAAIVIEDLPAMPDISKETHLINNFIFVDNELEIKKFNLDTDKVWIEDGTGKALSKDNYTLTINKNTESGFWEVKAEFKEDYIYSDAFYANAKDYKLHLPGITNISDQTLTADDVLEENTAEVTVDDDEKETNEVNVKPIYTESELSKKVLQYSGSKTPEELIDMPGWKDLEWLVDHDTNYAYRLDYQLGNHMDYKNIVLSDDQFADIQQMEEANIAVFMTQTSKNGTTERVMLDKYDYDMMFLPSEELATDGEKNNTSIKLTLKDPDKYERKTTKLTVVLADVTLKGTTGKEEYNYLDREGKEGHGEKLVVVNNISHLHYETDTPEDGDKGVYDKDSNKVTVIPPTIAPQTEKKVESDSAGDIEDENEGEDNTGDNGSGETTVPGTGGEDGNGETDPEEGFDSLVDAILALNDQLDINGDIEFHAESDYAKAYKPILAEIRENLTEDGQFKEDVTIEQIEDWIKRLQDAVELSTEKPTDVERFFDKINPFN